MSKFVYYVEKYAFYAFITLSVVLPTTIIIAAIVDFIRN